MLEKKVFLHFERELKKLKALSRAFGFERERRRGKGGIQLPSQQHAKSNTGGRPHSLVKTDVIHLTPLRPLS